MNPKLLSAIKSLVGEEVAKEKSLDAAAELGEGRRGGIRSLAKNTATCISSCKAAAITTAEAMGETITEKEKKQRSKFEQRLKAAKAGSTKKPQAKGSQKK